MPTYHGPVEEIRIMCIDDNGIADASSRFQEARFRHLAPSADIAMTPLPAWVQ